jgi:hypothetical protein
LLQRGDESMFDNKYSNQYRYDVSEPNDNISTLLPIIVILYF